MGFISTWGLDVAEWGSPTSYPYVLVGGATEIRAYKYESGAWNEPSPHPAWWDEYLPGHVEDCVFYQPTSGSFDLNKVLICVTWESQDEDGLYYWDTDYSCWHYIGDQGESCGYGTRMWRKWEDQSQVLMYGPNAGEDGLDLYSINLDNGSTFTTTSEFSPAGVEVLSVLAFNRWKEAEDHFYYYVVAKTCDDDVTTFDIWVREYDEGWGNWGKVITDINNTATSDINISIAGRSYSSANNTHHRIYIYTTINGLLAYNTQDNPISAIKLSDSAGKNTEGYTVQDIYICPFASDDDSDVIVYGQSQLYTLIWDGAKVLSSTGDTQSLNSRP
jgi:hypothetical protein